MAIRIDKRLGQAVSLGFPCLLVLTTMRAGAWPKGVPYPDPYKLETVLGLPTPRQQSQGFDRQLIITTRREGIGLGNPKLVYNRGGKQMSFPLVAWYSFAVSGQRNQFVMPLSLSHIPVSLGQLTLVGDLYLMPDSWDTNKRAKYYTNSKGQTDVKPAPYSRFSCVVRRAGQTIEFPPTPNKKRPFSVVAVVERSRVPTDPARSHSAVVLLKLLNAKGEKKQPPGTVTFDNIRMVTAKGQTHPIVDGKHGQIIGRFDNDVDPNKDDQVNYRFACYFEHIPTSQGQITLKTNVSIDNCWSYPVSIRIR